MNINFFLFCMCFSINARIFVFGIVGRSIIVRVLFFSISICGNFIILFILMFFILFMNIKLFGDILN